MMFKGMTYPNPCVFGCFWLNFGEGGEISAVFLQIFFGHAGDWHQKPGGYWNMVFHPNQISQITHEAGRDF